MENKPESPKLPILVQVHNDGLLCNQIPHDPVRFSLASELDPSPDQPRPSLCPANPDPPLARSLRTTSRDALNLPSPTTNCI